MEYSSINKEYSLKGNVMRTFNRNNTENVKQERKKSKELRKLRINSGYTLAWEDDSDKIKGAKFSFNELYEYDHEEY